MSLCKYRPNKIWSCIPTVAEDVIYPVTLDQVKAHLRITFMDDDEYIGDLIEYCTDGLEQFCHISMIIKTITLDADLVEELELPEGPVASVTSVMYRNGAVYEANTGYILSGDAGSFMRFAPGTSGRYKIVYVAGPFVQPSLKLDLLRIIAYCYEHRGDEALSSLQGSIARPQGLDQALELFAAKYRRLEWV